MNTCKNPLKITYNPHTGYKVNKPNDQSGEYVDKEIADKMLHALIDIRERCMADDPEFNLPKLNEAIELNSVEKESIPFEEPVLIGTDVFSLKDKYYFEMIPLNGGKPVILSFYKEELAPYIVFKTLPVYKL